MRAVCYRCFKPQITCICESVPRLQNRTPITVLQHPRERHHPLGTVRFLELGLQSVRVIERGPGETAAPVLPPGAGVLYPAKDARDLALLPASERPPQLVVLDGTWHQAKTLYRDTPWVQSLPHYTFGNIPPSRYRIRREPRPEYVSTLEATLHALRCLEPDLVGVEELLEAFDRMIDDQIEQVRARTSPSARTRKRRRGVAGLPRALFERFESLVLVYAEACNPGVPSHEAEGTEAEPWRASELLYFAGYRLSDGDAFELLIRPAQGSLNQRHLAHLQLSDAARARLEPGVPFAEFRRRWAAFSRPGDVYAAWNQSALRWLEEPGREKGDHVLLKAAYGRLDRHGGALEEIAAAEGFAPAPVPFSGRARTRVGNALSLLQLLRQVPMTDPWDGAD